MSVHYKFKDTLDYDAIKFDGVYITTADLKNIIIQQKKLVKGDSDLKITNEETGNSYTDDQLIPKNTSLIISRVPFAQPNKRARIGDSRTSNSASQSSSLSNIESGVSSSDNASTNNNSSNGSAGPYHSSNRHHHSLSRGHHPNDNHLNSANNNNSNDTLETSNHLSTKPSELMTQEERMRQVQSLSTQPSLLPQATSNDGQERSLESWLECYRDLQLKIEYQRGHSDNLELMKKYSVETHKQYITCLEKILKAMIKKLDSTNQSIKEANWARKMALIKVDEKFESLQVEWNQLVETNLALEDAISRLSDPLNKN